MPSAETPAFMDSIQAIQKGEQNTHLEQSVASVLESLVALNTNNKSGIDGRKQLFADAIVSSINGILLLALEGSIKMQNVGIPCSKLLLAGWKIGCAWDAVLAGDIDDLMEHLENESDARNLT